VDLLFIFFGLLGYNLLWMCCERHVLRTCMDQSLSTACWQAAVVYLFHWTGHAHI